MIKILAKLYHFTNLDFPEIRGFAFQIVAEIGGNPSWKSVASIINSVKISKKLPGLRDLRLDERWDSMEKSGEAKNRPTKWWVKNGDESHG